MGGRAVRGLLCLALVAGTVQAQAAGASGCGPMRATSPAPEARRSGPGLQVTDAHTAARPLVVRYDHRPGGNAYHQAHVMQDLVHTVVQVRSRQDRVHLWVRAEFAEDLTDIDLYVYDARATMRAWSESANRDVEDDLYDVVFYESDAGGPGFENVDALQVRRCATFTLETENSLVLESTPVSLQVWLGPPAD